MAAIRDVRGHFLFADVTRTSGADRHATDASARTCWSRVASARKEGGRDCALQGGGHGAFCGRHAAVAVRKLHNSVMKHDQEISSRIQSQVQSYCLANSIQKNIQIIIISS